MQHFKAPKEHLDALSAEAVASLIAAAAEIAVVLDSDGVIRDFSVQNEALSSDLGAHKKWFGKRWSKIVAPDSRQKIELLLREAKAHVPSPWRQINHAVDGKPDFPALYSVIRIGGKIVALGRDLRPVASMQQRLVDAQALIERDYEKLRKVEMRYRLLFELSTDAVLIVDAGTLEILEANPVARRLLHANPRRSFGKSLLSVLSKDGAASVRALLDQVRLGNRADVVDTKLATGQQPITISASLFKQDENTLFLVRLGSKATPDGQMPKMQIKKLKLVDNSPDGFVVTSADGAILTANTAFLEMVNVGSEEGVRGQLLGRWVGRPGVDADVLLSNLRRRGSIRLYNTTLNTEFGQPTEIEVSAVSVMNGGAPCYGFVLRGIGPRLKASEAPLHRSPEQLAGLIGRISMKDLIRETTDVIERLCIETALDLTKNNRAAAADLLGLSRQSLYIKMRRYGLENDANEPDDSDP